MQILVEFNSIIHAVWFGEFDLEESLSVDSIMDVLENNYICRLMLFLPDIVGCVLKKVWGMYS